MEFRRPRNILMKNSKFRARGTVDWPLSVMIRSAGRSKCPTGRRFVNNFPRCKFFAIFRKRPDIRVAHGFVSGEFANIYDYRVTSSTTSMFLFES